MASPDDGDEKKNFYYEVRGVHTDKIETVDCGLFSHIH